MTARRLNTGAAAMASRWRRRPMCVLIDTLPSAAALRSVSARGAFLETNARPAIGSSVELRHPEAGAIGAVVRSIAGDGIGIGFDYGAASVGFALAATAADMTLG